MRGLEIFAAAVLAWAAMPASAVPAQPGEDDVWAGPEFDSVALSRSFLIGSWTDDGDCDHAVEFLGDGRFFAGASAGIWQLDGYELTLTSENVLVIRLVPIDEDTLGVISEDGAVGESTRCSGSELLLPGPDETV